MTLAWILLALAVAIEVGATASLPRTEGFTNLPWTGFVIVSYVAAIALLGVIVKTIPVSVTYAVWAGLGTALVAVVGYFFLGEEMTWLKAACLGLIVVGVVGLNLTGTAH